MAEPGMIRSESRSRTIEGSAMAVTIYGIKNCTTMKKARAWLEDAGIALVDWRAEPGTARSRIGGRVALQGNMDPAIMATNPQAIEREVANILADFGAGSGHVFNLGHGITPGIDPGNVAALVDAVHDISAQYHQ